jgi:hypothetical protein
MTDHNEEYYRQKYLKYKAKYLTLETQVAGGLFNVLKSMNGFYFIFHKNIDNAQIIYTDDKIKNMIPKVSNSTKISIGLTDISMFMRNEHQIDKLFEDAIIVRLYLDKDIYMFDICEYIYYGSKKKTLTINATEIINDKLPDIYFKDINIFIKSLNLEDPRVKNILTLLQNKSITKLIKYYETPQNIDEKIQTLIEAKKVGELDLTKLIPELTHVFIVSDIKKQTLPPRVSMNIKNIKIL